MKSFNLTAWALNHKQLVYYFIVVIFLGGIFSYQNLGRMEDPDFTIRQMVVTVNWPGATARQIEEQVTDKVEKKLQDTPGLDYLKSYSRPGQSIIYVVLKDDAVTESQIRPTWLEVRNMVNDIKATLPQGVDGPYFNDRFDDVYGSIYALTGDGYTYEELRERAETIRRTLLGVPNVKKVELVGVQTEKIYIEMETVKLAQLGMTPADITNAVQAQNAMAPSGMLETSSDNVYLRITGMFENLDDLKNLPIRANGNTFRLGDIAKIERSYIDPPDPKMYYNSQPAVGLALSMEKGGNILTLGENLDKVLSQIKKNLPAGLELNTVSNQPKIVKSSIDEFVESLAEAVIIVLIVSFLSLGLRSGMIVTFCIPLVIAGVFIAMKTLGIDLHKISLGALIIALGLLVDDAIIVIEMVVVKLEQGWSRFDAACFAYTSTASPRLTGALITCAGFIPVGFSKGSASEFVGSIFSVVTIALLISWAVAGMVTPLFGYNLLKISPVSNTQDYDIYDTKFYRLFKKILIGCLTHRKKVLGATVLCFVGSIFLLGLVKQEFFPASTRPELIVEIQLPEGASLQATEQEAERFARHFTQDNNVASYTYYVGEGAPRFVLTADPKLPNTNFAQFVIIAKDSNARTELSKKAHELFATELTNVRGNISLIKLGPSDPYPVMLRVSGPNHDKVREIAGQVRDSMTANPNLTDTSLDWNEKSKVMHLSIDQDKARMLGLNSQTLASSLQALVSGTAVTEFREKDKTVSIDFRVDSQNRNDLSRLKDLNIHIGNGKYVPLDQIAKISYDAEEGLIWRRDLKPTITVQANTIEGVMGNDATQAVYDNLKELRASLPPGYSIDIGGPLELSTKATRWLLQPVPVMVLIITTLLMFQLQNIPKMVLTLLTAPLGIIGVSLGLLLTGRPMGFVVQLGLLALAGIIMRNSVILIDQIEQQIKAGEPLWDAIINATVARFRPILLTAAAAILGMIPLVSSVFWGPMAVAIAAGLFGATVLTLLVLPTMYAAWYKAEPNQTPPHDTPAGQTVNP
ncbi:efflux RND transporter permease subunit [Sporomusa acidovorans]|uniref:Efflux pump membrane transporter BepE n=1 Tax=Sporomusa acidovorans (strain ATCC 49682 / DSM 3132 / Mol) TaxID=1123286 RepID=A0ABZ3J4S4_SPOA4|nr:efflux RND transporter permease subunit [Sporomusa acidovorans]OZC23515.1 efflux pump membrane transporter BepE [Sporomusa acidovorans DSM 3132]SDF47631.1 Multidrug efflux pump subunit AcrB [Sporomusa acidovorans]